jgi:hypothetical protein
VLGAKEINYTSLEPTGANFAAAGYTMDKASLSVGKIVTGGVTFARGNKDSCLLLDAPAPYSEKMDSASTWHVVLYDIEDRRAWLVDGANALLHLTRARLSQKRFARSMKPDLEKFPYANLADGKDAALNALEKIGSQNQALVAEKQSSVLTITWGLKDIVLGFWHILEQIHDHKKVLSGTGVPLRITD